MSRNRDIDVIIIESDDQFTTTQHLLISHGSAAKDKGIAGEGNSLLSMRYAW